MMTSIVVVNCFATLALCLYGELLWSYDDEDDEGDDNDQAGE